jgi:hypothetical protein
MEIKFVSDEKVKELEYIGTKKKTKIWTDFMEELYKHPNRWAEFPVKVNSSASAYAQLKKFKDIEIKLMGGNNLAKNHPDKKQWTVFIRFTPETPAKIEDTKAPSKKK